jgi:hypothetical protein
MCVFELWHDRTPRTNFYLTEEKGICPKLSSNLLHDLSVSTLKAGENIEWSHHGKHMLLNSQ